MSGAALIAGSMVTGAFVWFVTRPARPRVLRAAITPAEGQTLGISFVGRDFAVSPDATRVVYAGNSGTQLFVRVMDQLEAMPLSGLGFPNSP